MIRELRDQIPDAENVLALEPEELAGRMLAILVRAHPGNFHRHNVCSEAMHAGISESYTAHGADLFQALIEAFVWLENQGLVIPNPGSDTWSIVSRRGQRVVAENSFDDFRAAASFPRHLVHISIRDAVWHSFIRQDYATAVFQAMRAVEVSVREAAGLSDKDLGVNLMRKAFDKSTGPLTDMDMDEGEREARAHLFAGATGAFKNPHSHRNVPLDDPAEATEIIMLASHLLRIVDARRNAEPS